MKVFYLTILKNTTERSARSGNLKSCGVSELKKRKKKKKRKEKFEPPKKRIFLDPFDKKKNVDPPEEKN